jgi:hypothetical protein
MKTNFFETLLSDNRGASQQIPFIKIDPRLHQQCTVFFFERDRPMMFLLALDIFGDVVLVPPRRGERSRILGRVWRRR